ncbi:hypothetical protein Tco_0528315 [Tanacetum coccineum]
MKVEESHKFKVYETALLLILFLSRDVDLLEVDIIENQRKDLEVKENEPLNKQISNIKESKDHPLGTVIGNLNQRTLRSQVQNQSNFFCFVSSVEPKNIKEAIQDESWTMAMQEELTQFKTNDLLCYLVLLLKKPKLSSVQNGSLKTNLTKMVSYLETKQDLKDTINKKEYTSMKPMPRWQD